MLQQQVPEAAVLAWYLLALMLSPVADSACTQNLDITRSRSVTVKAPTTQWFQVKGTQQTHQLAPGLEITFEVGLQSVQCSTSTAVHFVRTNGNAAHAISTSIDAAGDVSARKLPNISAALQSMSVALAAC